MRFLILAAALSVAPIAILASSRVPVSILADPKVAIREATPARKVTGTPTYDEVEPILKANCVPCHQAGEVAPFSLEGFRNASQFASMNARVVAERRMPPWKPTEAGVFHGERRLTEAEIEIIRHWADAGAPRGSYEPTPRSDEPENVIARSSKTKWRVGTPDKILTIPRPYLVRAEAEDTYRYFVVKNPFAETRWLRAAELQPGNTKVVHHATIFLDSSGKSLRLASTQQDGQEGYSASGGPQFKPTSVVGFWAPGMESRELPTGTAFELKPGASFVVQVHYTSTGKDETDQWKLGLYTGSTPPEKLMRVSSVESFIVDLPAGQKDCAVMQSLPINQDIELQAVMPHAHQLGKLLTAIVQLPDGREKKLIEIKDWDPAWQSLYWYKAPIKIPRGSVLRFRVIYDNSDDNPRNPFHPPHEIHWGEDAKAEMCLFVFLYTTR